MAPQPRFIDIHVLQSVPFANLNRDDTNSVKTVLFGNALRTRVSSQSWKRAARDRFQQLSGHSACRTRRVGEAVTKILVERKWPHQIAERAGAHVAAGSSIKFELDKEDSKPVPNRVLTNAMIYVPDAAVADLADLAETHRAAIEDAKDIKKPSDKSALPKDAVEAILRQRNPVINLFGRMLAEIDRAGVDGAVQVAHAMTTHTTDVELDYFTAVDDVSNAWGDESGSAHMGHTEYNAGTFYRYATVDLDALTANLGDDPTLARTLVRDFLDAYALSLPQAKKNSTAAQTIPHLVHIVARSDRPVSYAAAFEQPIRAAEHGGHASPSVRSLADYAHAVNGFLGDRHVLHRAWASPDFKDVHGLGERADSLDALLAAAVAAALPSPATSGEARQ
ncbi:type I-E CRISPR-associated protein Cas7/Cse4/CasC [Streptomyces sp. NPDC047014]|uniref:type I-E CRISPR-associated protein Cas7/Cse4/CasC n=1 Tax=Streptomyces sp. NPDC047014 TaxID=3155736 RepID=UPI0033D06F15